MNLKMIPGFAWTLLMVTACQNSGANKTKEQAMDTYEKGTFGYDLNFLKEKDSVIVLSNTEGNGQLIVSPKYQGKVFTSTAEGLAGKSFGWVNYGFFDKDTDPHMNAYGAEDRLWLGPEGGPFSLFFKPGAKMDFENWKTPAAFDTEAWTLLDATGKKASLSKDMDLLNYKGTVLHLRVDRVIGVLESSDIASDLGISLQKNLNAVGFETSNVLTNTGDTAWTAQTGAPCMWNLDMFSPSPKTVIIVPYKEQGTGKVATTDYFGEIPADRIAYHAGVILFKADGTSRGKLGLPPNRARNTAGSYDAESNVLTVTKFDMDSAATYLNQEWTTSKDPFKGDAVNAYNDGPLADGSQMGPFLEIESVSPAAFLKPGEKLSHTHRVYHFTGDKAALDTIARKVFNISLDEVTHAFDQNGK